MRFSTFDSTLSFYENQLTNLDRRLYEPLYRVTWGRDIKLRTDISLAFESTNFRQLTIGAAGNQNPTGISFISPETSTIPDVSVDGQQITTLLRPWGRELTYTKIELERSQQIGFPIDIQKFNAMTIRYQMDVDQMVYVGQPDLPGGSNTGLCNNPNITPLAVSGFWTPTYSINDILGDINTLLTSVWAATGYSEAPDTLLLPPYAYSLIVNLPLSILNTGGSITSAASSVLEYIRRNNISTAENGKLLDIYSAKWLEPSASNPYGSLFPNGRMVAYTNAEDRVRFPLVPIRRETPSYVGIRYIAPYLAAFGAVEFVYPETVGYSDGMVPTGEGFRVQQQALAANDMLKKATKKVA